MTVIIRLQNLPWSATAVDIRRFFTRLSIPDGGVHIVGGDWGDAFIAFSADEDARQAMMLNGKMLLENQVSLLLSSKAEMQSVIAKARELQLSRHQSPQENYDSSKSQSQINATNFHNQEQQGYAGDSEEGYNMPGSQFDKSRYDPRGQFPPQRSFQEPSEQLSGQRPSRWEQDPSEQHAPQRFQLNPGPPPSFHEPASQHQGPHSSSLHETPDQMHSAPPRPHHDMDDHQNQRPLPRPFNEQPFNQRPPQKPYDLDGRPEQQQPPSQRFNPPSGFPDDLHGTHTSFNQPTEEGRNQPPPRPFHGSDEQRFLPKSSEPPFNQRSIPQRSKDTPEPPQEANWMPPGGNEQNRLWSQPDRPPMDSGNGPRPPSSRFSDREAPRSDGSAPYGRMSGPANSFKNPPMAETKSIGLLGHMPPEFIDKDMAPKSMDPDRSEINDFTGPHQGFGVCGGFDAGFTDNMESRPPDDQYNADVEGDPYQGSPRKNEDWGEDDVRMDFRGEPYVMRGRPGQGRPFGRRPPNNSQLFEEESFSGNIQESFRGVDGGYPTMGYEFHKEMGDVGEEMGDYGPPSRGGPPMGGPPRGGPMSGPPRGGHMSGPPRGGPMSGPPRGGPPMSGPPRGGPHMSGPPQGEFGGDFGPTVGGMMRGMGREGSEQIPSKRGRYNDGVPGSNVGGHRRELPFGAEQEVDSSDSMQHPEQRGIHDFNGPNAPRRGHDAGRKRGWEEDVDCFALIENLPQSITYRDVRRFLGGCEIPREGLKLINDEEGNRVGLAYVMFVNKEVCRNALQKDGQVVCGSVVKVSSCSAEDFECAVDSYLPPSRRRSFGGRGDDYSSRDAPRDYCIEIMNVPYRASEIDVKRFLSSCETAENGGPFMMMDESGRSLGMAVAKLKSYRDFKQALSLHRTSLMDRPANVRVINLSEFEEKVRRLTRGGKRNYSDSGPRGRGHSGTRNNDGADSRGSRRYDSGGSFRSRDGSDKYNEGSERKAQQTSGKDDTENYNRKRDSDGPDKSRGAVLGHKYDGRGREPAKVIEHDEKVEQKNLDGKETSQQAAPLKTSNEQKSPVKDRDERSDNRDSDRPGTEPKTEIDQEKSDIVTPSDEYFCVKLEGIPPHADGSHIRSFMGGLQTSPRGVHVYGAQRKAFVEFVTSENCHKALELNGKSIDSAPITVSLIKKRDMLDQIKEFHDLYRNTRQSPWTPVSVQVSNMPTSQERFALIRMTNVSIRAHALDIVRYFDGFKVHPRNVRILTNPDGRPSGEATVRIETIAEAKAIVAEKNYRMLMGRTVELTIQ